MPGPAVWHFCRLSCYIRKVRQHKENIPGVRVPQRAAPKPMRKTVIVFVFIAIIAAPALGYVLGESALSGERPALSPLPAFSGRALLYRTFYSALEDYLDDRNPFRGRLIRAKAWIDVRVFGSSSTPDVHMGRDGWRFYGPALRSFQKDDCDTTPLAYGLARRLHRLEGILHKAGKRLVFVVAPDKATIYPEYVGGARPGNDCGRSFYDLLLEAMKRYPVDGFVRLDKALREAKREGLVYYRGGAHWNDRGAAIAAGLILEKLSTRDVSYRLPELEFEEREVLSETSPMLAVALYERALFAKEMNPGQRVQTIGIKKSPDLPGQWLILKTRAAEDAAPPLLPRTVMYRDSFMTAPLRFLKGFFREIYARWSHTFPEKKGADPEEIEAAKIILIEIAERDLPELTIRPRGAGKMLSHGAATRAGARKSMDEERAALPASRGAARKKGLKGKLTGAPGPAGRHEGQREKAYRGETPPGSAQTRSERS